jgi:peptidyl-prolyl cis-trans isomerase A (cyclophilin A)
LAGPASKEFDSPTLPDDPNWLPEGPDFRRDEATGVMRFATGYLAYAGAGPNSRGVQLIVALAANGPLGGGSPWEVPWGETVGVHSFETLSQIYTGYGEKGPSQALLHREGASENVAKQFPKLDYINSCQIVDEEEQSPGDEEMAEEE